jgi:hypothetical protein
VGRHARGDLVHGSDGQSLTQRARDEKKRAGKTQIRDPEHGRAMDAKNRFHTKTTYALVRTEHIAVVAICAALTLLHAREISWWEYAASFWVIDLVGYVPGAIAYRAKRGGPISPLYHDMYNVAHTYLVVGGGVAVWAAAAQRFEWAMLGPVIHLSIDRGVFGNVFKPRALSFEPVSVSIDTAAAALELGATGEQT